VNRGRDERFPNGNPVTLLGDQLAQDTELLTLQASTIFPVPINTNYHKKTLESRKVPTKIIKYLPFAEIHSYNIRKRIKQPLLL